MEIKCAKCGKKQKTDSDVGEDFNCKYCGTRNTIHSSKIYGGQNRRIKSSQ